MGDVSAALNSQGAGRGRPLERIEDLVHVGLLTHLRKMVAISECLHQALHVIEGVQQGYVTLSVGPGFRLRANAGEVIACLNQRVLHRP